MTLTKEQLDILKAPFAVDEHEFHPYTKNVYIREWAICDRIEEVDPAWTLEHLSTERRVSDGSKDKTLVVMTFRMTVCGVSRDGVGMADVNLTKDSSDEANEAEKSAATDALKRCARLFGVGRYLLRVPRTVKNERDLGRWLGGDTLPEGQAGDAVTNAGEPDTTANTAVINWVEIRLDKKENPYIFAEGGYTSFTREPFRRGGIPCDMWENPGRYVLLKPVVIEFDHNNGFRNITTARFQDGEAVS